MIEDLKKSINDNIDNTLNFILKLFFRKQNYPCSDYHRICRIYVRNNPKTCQPSHNSYPFMRAACMRSCNRCGGQVNQSIYLISIDLMIFWQYLSTFTIDLYERLRSLLFKGCRDEFEGCEKWKNAGYCVKVPDFMQFNCRETCGTYGFLSRKFPRFLND